MSLDEGRGSADLRLYGDSTVLGASASVEARFAKNWAAFGEGWAAYDLRERELGYGAFGGVRWRW